MSRWPRIPLEDLATADGFAIGPFGSRMKSEHYSQEGLRVVRGQNITQSGRIEGEFVHISEEFANSLGSARLRVGDITLPHRGAIGRAALVDEGDMVMSTSLMRIRLDLQKAVPAFVVAYLTSVEGVNEILQFASTVGTPGIGQPLSSLRRVRVPLPSLPEQRRIGAVLGALNDLIELNAVTRANLRAMALASFDAACVDGEVVKVGDIATPARDGVSGAGLIPGTPYLGLEHFGMDGLGIRGVGDAAKVDSFKSLFKTGDVLFGKLRPYFRKLDRPGFDGVCSTEIWVLRPRNDWGAATLHAIVARPEFTEFAMAGNTGTRMPRANWSHVATMEVTVPGVASRAKVNQRLEQLWLAGVALSEEIYDLEHARDELLPLLMSGRVRVSEDFEVA